MNEVLFRPYCLLISIKNADKKGKKTFRRFFNENC